MLVLLNYTTKPTYRQQQGSRLAFFWLKRPKESRRESDNQDKLNCFPKELSFILILDTSAKIAFPGTTRHICTPLSCRCSPNTASSFRAVVKELQITRGRRRRYLGPKIPTNRFLSRSYRNENCQFDALNREP